MSDVKYDSEKLTKEAQDIIDKFKVKMKDIADETLGELYCDIMPYFESDTASNYRQELRLELEHEYKFSEFKDAWAVNFRKAVFVENREEISKLIESDILKRIKHLEDCRQEYEQFRYTPVGDRYQDLVKKLKQKEDDIKILNEVIEDAEDTVKDYEAMEARIVELEHLESSLLKAVEALEFYANEKQWATITVGDPIFEGFIDGDFCDAFNSDHENNRQDSGQRARQTLSELKETINEIKNKESE